MIQFRAEQVEVTGLNVVFAAPETEELVNTLLSVYDKGAETQFGLWYILGSWQFTGQIKHLQWDGRQVYGHIAATGTPERLWEYSGR